MRDFKHSLLNYSIKRLLQGIPLIILVVLFSFAIIQFAPGEPISLIAGGDDMTQEQIDYLTEQWGAGSADSYSNVAVLHQNAALRPGHFLPPGQAGSGYYSGAFALYPAAFDPFASDRHSDWRICGRILCDAHAQYRRQRHDSGSADRVFGSSVLGGANADSHICDEA